MRLRVPAAFASLLAQERDTPSCLATVAILMPGADGAAGCDGFEINIPAARLRVDLIAVYLRRTFAGLRNRVGRSGATSFAVVLSRSVDSAT